jgi:hypothetical protein
MENTKVLTTLKVLVSVMFTLGLIREPIRLSTYESRRPIIRQI